MAGKLTVQQFLDLILQTEISEAKEWLEDFRKKEVPAKLWPFFCSIDASENTVDNIAFGISRQMSRCLRVIKDPAARAEMSKRAHKFLQEIWKKADDIGIKTELKNIDQIFEPVSTI